jgi:hypothetical protein
MQGKSSNIVDIWHGPNLEFFALGGPSFSSGIRFAYDSGLQPLKLQGLKPQMRRSSSSGLKFRPPKEKSNAEIFQIKTAMDIRENRAETNNFSSAFLSALCALCGKNPGVSQ